MKMPKAPGLTAEEKNLRREQQDELRMQGQEKRRRISLMGSGGRRSLLSGAETGVM